MCGGDWDTTMSMIKDAMLRGRSGEEGQGGTSFSQSLDNGAGGVEEGKRLVEDVVREEMAERRKRRKVENGDNVGTGNGLGDLNGMAPVSRSKTRMSVSLSCFSFPQY